MKRAYWTILIVGGLYVVAMMYVHANPNLLCVVGVLLTFLVLAVILGLTVIAGLSAWRSSSRFWMMPSALCLAFLLSFEVAAPAGRSIADWQFNRRLQSYTEVINDVKEGKASCVTPCNGKLAVVQVSNPPPHVRALKAARCGDGSVVVAFLSDTDVPILHEGYVFNDAGQEATCQSDSLKPEKNWPYVRHVAGNWHHFSDQPGL